MRRSIITILFVLLLSIGLVLCCIACSDTDSVEGGYSGNDVVKIRIYEFPLTSVYQGDDLDLTDCKIQAVSAKGGIRLIDVTADMISDFDKNVPGEQTVSVTYAGKTATVKIVVIASAVESISIAEIPAGISVVQGSDLDISGIKLNINYQSTSVIFDGITYAMLRGYSSDLPVGTHTIYIDYAGYETSFKLTVLPRSLKEMKVISTPKKTGYFVGATLDMSGFSVMLKYDNGTSKTVEYDAEHPEVFDVSYDFSQENPYSRVIVSYKEDNIEKSVSFTCAVARPSATGMEITVEPKTVGVVVDGVKYISDIGHIREGDKIDWKTGKASIAFEDGTHKDVVLSDRDLNCFLDDVDTPYIDKNLEFTDVGAHIIYIRYGNNDWYTPLHISVDAKKAHRLLVADTNPDVNEQVTNKVFVDGQMFPLGYLRYNTLYNNGTYEYSLEDTSEWGFLDASKLSDDGSKLLLDVKVCKNGYQTVNFTVGGVSAGFKVKVAPRVATKVRIDSAPYRNYYLVGDVEYGTLKLNGLAVYVEYNDKTFNMLYENEEDSSVPPEAIKIYRDGYEQVGFSVSGEYLVKIEVDDVSDSFVVNVLAKKEDLVTNVEVKGYDGIRAYECSSITALHKLMELSLNVTYGRREEGNKTEDVALDKAEMLTTDTGASGERNVMFRYAGYAFTIKANVIGRRVSAIEVVGAPDTTVYVKGESDSLDLRGLKIARTFNDGTASIVSNFASSNWRFTGFNPDAVGIQTVTATYTVSDRVYTTTFEVEVAETAVKRISFDSNQNGMQEVEVDGKTYKAYFVTYRDDFNSTYVYAEKDSATGLYNDAIGNLYFNVEFVGSNTVFTRPLNAGYIDYDKYVIYDEVGNYIQKVTIAYGGKTTQFDVYVVNRTLASVNVYAEPDIRVYAEGQRLRTEGGYIERIFNDGTRDVLPMTNGHIAINGYSEHPFDNVQGTNSLIQTVTLTCAGKSTSYNVTTYRKLYADPKCDNSTFSYGDATVPKVTINQSIAGFTVPDTEVEYEIDGVWTTDVPVFPGKYQMRIHVFGNEYYNESFVENDSLMLTITKRVIIVDVGDVSKTYGDNDGALTYIIKEGELVGNDKVEIDIWREEGEDVRYNAQGGYGSYTIYIKFKSEGQNQNAMYELPETNAVFTIYPKRIDTDRTGKIIDVSFIMPGNYNSADGTIGYTGSAIQPIAARYTDANGAINSIASKDILYYDEFGNLLTELPKAVGTYTVTISGNYEFKGSYSKTFSII